MFRCNLFSLSTIKFVSTIGVVLAAILFSASLSFAQSYLGNTTKTVNLREGPGTEYKVIERLQAGSQIFIISTKPTNQFLNVIYIKTAAEGWIQKNFIQIKTAVPTSSEGLFIPEGPTNSQNPNIEVYNNTSLKLTLNLNNRNYSFAPQERKTITLTPGTYKYRASAPGAIPFYGEYSLNSNYKYSLEFHIVKRRRP